jgi:hypothetical protein
MREQAKAEKLGPTKRHTLVYEGYTTRLFQQLQLPGPYYSSVMQRLASMGCIKQLSRGGGSSPSRWELLEDPELEAFIAAETEDRKPTRLDLVEQRLDDLEERMAAEG